MGKKKMAKEAPPRLRMNENICLNNKICQMDESLLMDEVI
jgi:hypothetical protein